MRHSETIIITDLEKDISDPKLNSSNNITIQFTIEHKQTGHVSGTAHILVSNDGEAYFCLDSIDVVGTNIVSDGIVNTVGWPYYLIKIEDLSPNSVAKVTMGLTKITN